MKILLSLTALSFTLALCQGACVGSPHKDGNMCTDPYDGSKHPLGSKWNTAECMECTCSARGMSCCSRYGGPVQREGCRAVVNPNTCAYEFFKLDDPSKPCP